MRKTYFTFLVIILFSALNFAQNLNSRISELNKSSALEHGQWSVYARYVDSGEELASYNPEYSLAPASGLKVFTSSVALSLLGEDYRFETRIYYDGRISNGTLNGNIYIVGGGDPTLGSDLVETSTQLNKLMIEWVLELQGKGIETVNGSVIADELLFSDQRVPDYWPWIDMGNYYGAGTSALTIHDNLYYLFFKPGNNKGDAAEVLRTEPFIPGLLFENHMKTGARGSGDNGYIYSAPEMFKATLRGTVPAGVKEFSIKGSMPDPALFAAQSFSGFLELNGIEVIGLPAKLQEKFNYDESKLITRKISPPLKDIVYIVNKRSNNLYTEQLLKTLGLEKNGEATTESGIKVIEQFLEDNGISTDGLRLYDGCGLSRTNIITTKMMVELLSLITKKSIYNSFYNSLGIAGDPGDISFYKGFGKGTIIAKNARVKSGLISGVRSHSGYVKDRSGRLIAYSMIANNFSGKVSEINNLHEKVLIMLAEL